jgi:hypothetical protein
VIGDVVSVQSVIRRMENAEVAAGAGIARRELAGSNSEVEAACRDWVEAGKRLAAAFRAARAAGYEAWATAEDDSRPCRWEDDAGDIGWQADCHSGPLGSAGQRSRGRTWSVKVQEIVLP